MSSANLHEPVESGPEPVERTSEVRVELQRSVRYGRIVVGAIVLGAILGAVAALMFPVREDVEYVRYTLGQITGFSAVIGAVIGLAIGALLSLILGIAAKRKRGDALVQRTDVR